MSDPVGGTATIFDSGVVSDAAFLMPWEHENAVTFRGVPMCWTRFVEVMN